MNKLFVNRNLKTILKGIEARIISHINAENDNYIANVDYDDYIKFIYEEYKVEKIVLREDCISCNSKQGLIETYNEYYSQIRYVDGIITDIIIPFNGESFILDSRATTYTYNPPSGEIIDDKLILRITNTMQFCEAINIEEITKDRLADIKQHLEYSHKDIDDFNESIINITKREIDKKLTKFNKFSSFLKTIPYPLKKDESAPNTYEVPTVRKKVTLTKPSVSATIQEPTLSINEYNNILKICSSMALVMERSPKAYAKMDEEAIRTQFLMQLNGQYQGQATGETFNGNGKTDILIRNDNQNIFIGECKFWKGEKAFLDTIDQLLGYVTYRDTKTAILLFVKKNDFTATVSKLKDIIPKHDNFVRQDTTFTPTISTAYRYIFKNKTDNDKELYITVMAFHVPCEEQK